MKEGGCDQRKRSHRKDLKIVVVVVVVRMVGVVLAAVGMVGLMVAVLGMVEDYRTGDEDENKTDVK